MRKCFLGIVCALLLIGTNARAEDLQQSDSDFYSVNVDVPSMPLAASETTPCTQDADCDDALFCNGVETCVGGACVEGVFPCQADEGCSEDSDTCGSAWGYSISNGEVTITNYAGSGGDVVIPDTIEGFPVVRIGDRAFEACSSLTSVTIPDSVTSIWTRAFALCRALTSISIPDSVTIIGEEAFYYCDSLTSVVIPDSVTSIRVQAFSSCTSLTSVIIPDSVTSIDEYAFWKCGALTSVSIGSGVTNIGRHPFKDCPNLSSFTVNTNNLFYSSQDGVLYNKNQTVLIDFPEGKSGAFIVPDSVISIGNSAFYYCDGLTSVDIPDSVTSIGERAFYGCISLTSVTIPDSVTSIRAYAFFNCTGLTSIAEGPQYALILLQVKRTAGISRQNRPRARCQVGTVADCEKGVFCTFR